MKQLNPTRDSMTDTPDAYTTSDAQRLSKLQVVLRRRVFLTQCAIVGFVITTVIAFLIPPRFESTGRLVPPDSQSGFGPALMSALASGSGLQTLGANMFGVKSTGSLFIGVMKSRTVADAMIARFSLQRRYGVRTMAAARKQLATRTTFVEDQKSGIITITVSDRDPAAAQQLAMAYIEELNSLVAQLSTSAARRERLFLEDRLKEIKKDLDVAEQRLSEFSSKNVTLDVKEQGRTMVEAAATLNGQLIAAQSELKGLEQIYSDQNIRVRTLHARIRELQHQLDLIGGKSTEPDKDQLYPSIRQLPLLGVAYADLYRHARIEETLYGTLTQQYELAKVQETREIPSVKVLDMPDVPERKAFPPRLGIMGAGTFLACALGLFWVLAELRWNDLDESHPVKAFAFTMLGQVQTDIPKLRSMKPTDLLMKIVKPSALRRRGNDPNVKEF